MSEIRTLLGCDRRTGGCLADLWQNRFDQVVVVLRLEGLICHYALDVDLLDTVENLLALIGWIQIHLKDKKNRIDYNLFILLE